MNQEIQEIVKLWRPTDDTSDASELKKKLNFEAETTESEISDR